MHVQFSTLPARSDNYMEDYAGAMGDGSAVLLDGAGGPPELPTGCIHGTGWFVVHHAERTAGDASDQPQLIATTRAEFTNTASEEIAQQFARAVELRTEIERNQDALAAARRRLLGGAAE